MKFIKMHGLGNDFVILDSRVEAIRLTAETIRHICDRRLGVGCDQLIVMEPADKADFFMRIYNPDGSEAGACGNATRCAADILFAETGRDRCAIETRRGVLSAAKAPGGLIRVDMGPPQLDWREIPLAQETDTLHLPLAHDGLDDPAAVGMGNPHCVFFVPALEMLDIAKLGPYFEHHALFPERTNVEFVQVLSRDKLRMRVWERGAGITQACGSGACAAAVAAMRRGLCDPSVEMVLDGGSLRIEWDQARSPESPVYMTGPAEKIFEGQLFSI